MAKGDIVLIPFPFTDLSGNKLRPAVILAESASDLTVCFVTSQTAWPEPSDVPVVPQIGNGFKRPSLIRTRKMATIDRALAKGLLGRLSNSEISAVNNKLKLIFQLP